MLFFLTWPDRYSVLVDLESEAAARAAAREIAGGAEPATCQPFDRLFVAEVYLDEDEDGAELLVVEPLQHVADALEALEEQAEDVAAAPLPETCAFELEDEDGSILRCMRAPHDDPHHEAIDANGDVASWDDDGAS
jgi:hypothetical protein